MKPVAYGEAFAAADEVLRSIGSALGLALPRLRFGLTDPRQVAEALAGASAAVRAAMDARPELAGAASLAASELAAARLDVLAWEALRGREVVPRLARILRGCRTAATVDELAEVIPPQTAELGYDRVLLSWVDHGRWIPRCACTRSDPAEATAIVAAGKPPYRRTSDLLEDQVVRMRSTILVRDARGNPRVHAELLAVTGSHSYVAAPLVLRERVVGLIHADRLDRKPNRQIAFGYGPHMCIGQHLAKQELRVMLEELLPRLVRLEVTGDRRVVQTNFVGGLRRLPMRLELT